MRGARRDLIAGVAALATLATLATGCGSGPSDDERRAEWEANEPHAYAYWFHWGDMETGYSVRVEIVDGEVVRTDLGPGGRGLFDGPEVPTIDDVFDLLDTARRSASARREDGARLDVAFDDLGFPEDVQFTSGVLDGEYGFGVAGFEVIEARRPDG